MRSALSFFKIVSKTNSFNMYDTLISDSVQTLQRDPSNKTAKANLSKALAEILNNVVADALKAEKQLSGSVILGTCLPPSRIKYNDDLYNLNNQI